MALLVVFITVISLPDDTYGQVFIHVSGVGTGHLPVRLNVSREPQISFKVSGELTSIGGLGAGKDIYMKVLLTDITPANWNDSYCCLAIATGASLGLPPTIYLQDTPPTLRPSSPPFTLYRFANGTYYTDGNFYVTQPPPSGWPLGTWSGTRPKWSLLLDPN